MLAPVYRTISTSAVKAIVGTNPRIYSYGRAPQGAMLPYITWFVVSGDPHLQLSGTPCGDSDTVQIDCWAGPSDDQEIACVNLAKAVRTALDDAGIANRVIINQRETDTNFFRIGLQADFIQSR